MSFTKEQLEQDIYGVDIWYEGDDVQIGPDGDWLSVVGKECFQQGIHRRVMSPKGSDVVDTDWGRAGESGVNELGLPVANVLVGSNIRHAALEDDRVGKCRVTYLSILQGQGIFYNLLCQTPLGEVGVVHR